MGKRKGLEQNARWTVREGEAGHPRNGTSLKSYYRRKSKSEQKRQGWPGKGKKHVGVRITGASLLNNNVGFDTLYFFEKLSMEGALDGV